MKGYLDRLRPLFAKGGRYEKYYPVFEMVDGFFYSSPETTHNAPHVRDGIDLKRLMMYVVVALIPCILWSWFNTGYQANLGLISGLCGPGDRILVDLESHASIYDGCALADGEMRRFLHNDIDTIDDAAQTLARLVPEARIRIAHGQMREHDLEHVMRDFYQQRFNVLLCTTIIETGIDIPSANTIIIDRADKFGLAQLHQLRGRVGRSHHQAYAYLLTPRGIEEKARATANFLKRKMVEYEVLEQEIERRELEVAMNESLVVTRTALRLGAREVHLVALESMEELPAFSDAAEEIALNGRPPKALIRPLNCQPPRMVPARRR